MPGGLLQALGERPVGVLQMRPVSRGERER